MTTRRAGNPVSLFPFLAVLVCAMGALIFLLLVVTRQIRAEVRAEAIRDARQDNVADSFPVPAPESPTAVVEETPDRLPEIDDVPPADVDWNRMIDELASRYRDDLRALKEARREIKKAELREAEIRTELLRIQKAGEADAAEGGKLEIGLKRLRNRAEKLRRELARQRSEIRDRKAKAASMGSRYAFLPLDSVNGTRRRPIFIECHSDRIEFASEKIGLTADDLDGYTQQSNPLLAGVRALVGYWSSQDLKRNGNSKTGVDDPYVLMVVRPGGIHAYYIARKLLRQLETPIGYELVPEKMTLAWPARDAAAALVCREAVDRTVARRASSGSGLGSGGSFVKGRRGTFDSRGSKGGRSSLLARSDKPKSGYRGDTTGSPKPGTVRGRLPTGRVDKGIPVGGEIPKSNGKRPGQTTETAETAETAEKSEKSEKSEKTQSDRGALPNRPEVPTFESLTVGGASSNGGASRGSGRAADGAPRQWGVASLGATIGYERTVDVKVEQDGVTVVGQPRIDVTTKGGNLLPVNELRRKVIRAVQKTARAWGPPPARFYWVPAIRFTVSPGGTLHYERLNSLFRSWRLSTSVNYVLPTAPEPKVRLIEEPSP